MYHSDDTIVNMFRECCFMLMPLKNIAFIAVILCCGFWISVHAEEAMPKQQSDRSHIRTAPLISQILAQPKKPRKKTPCLVFDIDDTLCKKLEMYPDEYSRLQMHQKIYSKSPGTVIVPFLTKRNMLYGKVNYKGKEHYCTDHAFFPYFGELFLKALLMGWNIDFFSAGAEKRNWPVIKLYLEQVFAPYSNNIKKDLKKLLEDPTKRKSVNSNQYRMRIFSKQHMVDEIKLEEADKKYAAWGIKKKDLRKLGLSPSNAILVEDDRTYGVGGEQYPVFHGVVPAMMYSVNDLYVYERRLYSCSFFPNEIVAYPQNEYAAFQMGVFLECAELMVKGKTLRQALRKLLRVERKWEKPANLKQHEKGEYLVCADLKDFHRRAYHAKRDLKDYKGCLKKRPEFKPDIMPMIAELKEKINYCKEFEDKIKRWICNGHKAFGEVRAMQHARSYNCMLEQYSDIIGEEREEAPEK